MSLKSQRRALLALSAVAACTAGVLLFSTPESSTSEAPSPKHAPSEVATSNMDFAATIRGTSEHFAASTGMVNQVTTVEHSTSKIAPEAHRVPPVPPGIEISVPAGAQLPVVLVEADEDFDPDTRNPARETIGDFLAMEFARDVAESQSVNRSNPGSGNRAAGAPAADELKRWREAAAKADERYQSLFGQDAYMERSLRSFKPLE
jgi:hypothetical protein